jgi:hypothetical protein
MGCMNVSRNGHQPVTRRTQSIKDAMVGNMINPSIKPARQASPRSMRKLVQARSETLKRLIQTDHLLAQFRGLSVPGRSPILLATGQIAHLLIDCPASALNCSLVAARERCHRVKGQSRSSFHLKSYSVAEFVRHAILRPRPLRPVRPP